MGAAGQGRKSCFPAILRLFWLFPRHLNGRFPVGVPAAQQHFYGK
jgi:hypothetical protein